MKARILMVLTGFVMLSIAVILLTSVKPVTAGAVRDVPEPASCSAALAVFQDVVPSEAHVGGADECNTRCLLSFCRNGGKQCTFTHTVLRNNGSCCCEYNCVDDPSCTNGSQGPANACPGT